MRNCYIVKFLVILCRKSPRKRREAIAPKAILPAEERPEISISSHGGFGLDIDDEPPIVTQL